MGAIIRLATGDDATGILAIYAPIVRETAISFEVAPPDVDQIRQRIKNTLGRFPWLVCAGDEQILGYAYASPHRDRVAYQWSVDVSVYVDAQARRSGVGRSLYTSLLNLVDLQGFYNAYAGITLPNPASVGLHEAMGFLLVGIYRSVGYKLGRWHDVGWWHRLVRAPRVPPDPPVEFGRIRGTPACERAVASGRALLPLVD
ncbi:MAG: GNAT family N-acetyltransferase [Armatimonadetes bacterium 13_1_40CM_64_14]|nr:MAG: GNAT family N-acetyltransferase [Armatimonadetes bacterium 13_1_40CM_64_14]